MLRCLRNLAPSRRNDEPEDVAEVVWALVQPQFAAVAGSNVLVDAGYEALTGF